MGRSPRLKTYRIGEWSKEGNRRCCVVIHLLRNLLEFEVTGIPHRTSLDEREDTVSICAEDHFSQSRPHLMNIVPIWNRQRIREPPEFVHEVELIPHQKHRHNQLHLQLGHLLSRARVSAASPAEERVGSAREQIGLQPPTGIVLVRFGVVFGVHVDITQGIREEISLFNYLFADFHISAKVPSNEEKIDGKSL